MSNDLEREILLFDQFEREQRSQETQKLRELTEHNTRAAWAAMTKKQNIKAYRAMVVDGEEVWSVDVVKAVYCSSMQEIKRLHKAKSDEAFDAKLNLVRGSLVTHHALLISVRYVRIVMPGRWLVRQVLRRGRTGLRVRPVPSPKRGVAG